MRAGLFAQRMETMTTKLAAKTLACLAMLSLGTPVEAVPLAYVPNEGGGTISVIDTDQDVVIKEIKAGAGSKPRGIATGKESKSLYVSDQPHNALLVVDLDKQQVAQSIDLGESPEGVAISPDGKTVAAAVEISNAVALVDAATGKRTATIKVEGKNPEHAVFSPDGKWIFVSAEEA